MAVESMHETFSVTLCDLCFSDSYAPLQTNTTGAFSFALPASEYVTRRVVVRFVLGEGGRGGG